MPNEPTPDSPEELWQSQIQEEATMTLEDIRRKAQKFQKRIRRRNGREYVGAAVATIVYGSFIWFLPGLLQKIGATVLLFGIFYVVSKLRKDGAAREVPVETSASDCLEFHRRETGRQRDLLRSAASHHLAALAPGVVLLLAGGWIENPEAPLAVFIGATAFAVAVFAGVSLLNLRAANKLQQELDALEE